jgi:mannose-1-phosphate guanylyltransferase
MERPLTLVHDMFSLSAAMNTLLTPSENDDADAIASAYLYAAKGDSRAALTQAVSDAVIAIEELRSRLEQAEQVVSYGFTRGEFVTRSRF